MTIENKALRPKILLLDDKPQNLYALRKLLETLDLEIFEATSGLDALALTLEHAFFVAIVDVQMPEMDGYEFVELLRGNASTAGLPVIFVSAIYSDEYHHRKGYDAGAVDFLSKPFVPEILLSKIRVFKELFTQRQALETANKQLRHMNQTLTERNQQLQASQELSEQITSILDLQKLLTAVVQGFQKRFSYLFVGVWLWDQARQEFRLEASTSEALSVGYILPAAVAPTLRQVIETQQICHQTDMAALEAAVFQADTGSEAAVFAPCMAGNRLLAVLDVRDNAPLQTPNNVSVLQMLANQLAVAIRNAQLYERLIRFNENLEDRVADRTAELAEAYEKLEKLDQNKTDFIEIVAHELRTPLSLVMGYSSLLISTPAFQEDEENLTYLKGINTGSHRMLEIVNTMLDVIKIDNQTLKLVIYELHVLELFVALQENLTESLQERHLSLTFLGLEDLPIIEADPEAIGKVFYNVLINAIKYTPDHGHIVVSGRVLGADGDALQSVELIVTDSGIGIDKEFHELIFTKFYQTGKVTLHSTGKAKFKGGGPGLGLAIAQGIVNAHHGRIWVESEGHDEENLPGSSFYTILLVKQPPKKELDDFLEEKEAVPLEDVLNS